MSNTEDSLDTNSLKKVPSIRQKIGQFVLYLPFFIISVIACVVGGVAYLNYKTPKYNVSTFILVKTNPSNSSGQIAGAEDLVTTVLNGSKEVLLDNELTLIKSRSLMEKVVLKNHFNVSCVGLNQFKKEELYPAPFKLTLSDTFNHQAFSLKITDLTTEGATITFVEDKENKTLACKWNTVFNINGETFVLTRTDKVSPFQNESYLINWDSAEKTAEDILDNLAVDILDKKTTILQIELIIQNKRRGEDILNALWKEYITQNIEDKNAISQNTIRFIDDRLNIISQELNGVEGSLEDYKGNNQIINAESQSVQSLNNSSEISKDITTLNIQKGVVEMLQNYFNNPENEKNPVPSNLGINDPTLASFILKFNELQIKKQRETPLLAINSPIMQDLNNQLNGLKKSILENLQNINKNLQLQESNLQQKNQQYNSFLSGLPHKERVIQTIKRKQTITEGLYLYLLQKREEAVISSSTSNISNYKQIDSAKGAKSPIEPKPRLVYSLAVMVGLIIPILWMRLRENLNDKIDVKKDVINRIYLPVLGEVNHISKLKSKTITVTNDEYLGEAFRKIRTTIASPQKKKASQVILITSTTIGEGKSIIAQNLARILAIPGKKVALLEFCFQTVNDDEVSNKKQMGITDYLHGDIKDVSDICQISKDISTLDFYSAGTKINNLSDLLLTDRLSEFFSDLKKTYQFIIIDSLAIDISSDAFVLQEYIDLVLFVLRDRYTSKTQLENLMRLASDNKLNSAGIILNDIRRNRFD